MIRLLAAIVAPLVVIAGLVLGLPTQGGEDLQRIVGIQPEAVAPTAAGDTTGDASAGTPADPAAALGAAVEKAARRKALARKPSGLTVAPVKASTATADDPPPLPLEVTMTGLSTAVVPKDRAVIVSGRVVNDSYETWTDINVYACTSGVPITTSHDLDHAAQATTGDVVCGRTSVFTTIDELAPGASAAYRLRVERDQLGIGQRRGVYWFGVQALGSSTEGRDSVADGTVRTFLPLTDEAGQGGPGGPDAGPKPAKAAFSLVLPIRARTLHTADGRLANAGTWVRDLGPQGRLTNVLAMAANAPAGEVTLLVDPAVVDAVRQMADGNPPRDLGAATADPDEEGSGDAGSKEAAPSQDQDQQDQATAEAAEHATAWLHDFAVVAKRLPVLALPYGDLDVAGASHHDTPALARARHASDAVFAALGIQTTPAIVPPNGLLPRQARELSGAATVIVSSAALPDELAEADSTPAAVTIGDKRVLVASSSLSLGGPGPTDGSGALALRQRLIAEGLLRSDEGSVDPALVLLPYDADPGPRLARFFDQLDRPFMRLTGALASPATAPAVDDLVYPAGQLDREIPRTAFAEASRLTEIGATLDRILPRNDGVSTTAAHEALSATSYFARDTSLAAAGIEGSTTAGLEDAVSWFSERLDRVDVAVPRFVILGSTEGPFAMTVSNGLTRPVRLGIRATTSGGLDIRAPRTIDVPASSSSTVNLTAKTTEPGVRALTLVVTDADGRPIQKSQEISIRSRDVGWVIWLIMSAGAALLFGAIAVRWRKRQRARTTVPTPTAVIPPAEPTARTDTETPEAP